MFSEFALKSDEFCGTQGGVCASFWTFFEQERRNHLVLLAPFVSQASFNSYWLTFPLHPCVKDVGIIPGPCSHPRWSQHTCQLMPGTLSPLEENTSVILLTSPVCYSILYRETYYSLLTVHRKQEGKHRDHTNFAYLLSFTNISKDFCGSSAIVIQQWQQNLFKTTPFAVQVSSDHCIMDQYRLRLNTDLRALHLCLRKTRLEGCSLMPL